MNSRVIWFGAVLIFGLAVAAWFLRRPASEEIAQAGTPDRAATAHRETPPAPSSAPMGQPEAEAEPAPVRANGNSSAAAAKPAQQDPRILAQERAFIAKLFELPSPGASEQERLFWEESPVQDLIYPDGHPCAGQPLDSTSPETLTAAGRAALAEVINAIPDVDVPQCLYQGNWPFFALNQACSGMNREDPESVGSCESFLQTSQQDPKAYPATIWLPCSGEGAQQTTRRQYFEELLVEQVQQVFSGPRCQF